MATKIGGDQLRLEDFIKNPAPNGDWTSSLFTASLAAIKALVAANGIPELSGEVVLWEKDPGFYFIHAKTRLVLSSSKGYIENYNSIILLSDFDKYNIKDYLIIECYSAKIVTGQTSERGGTIEECLLRSFLGATEQRQGRVGCVPAPQSGDQNKFLCGNGNWEKPTIILNAVATGYVPGTQEYSYTLELNGTPISKTQIINYIDNGRFIIAETFDTTFGQYYFPEKDYINNNLEFIFRKISVENGHFICKRLRCVTVNEQECWYKEIELKL